MPERPHQLTSVVLGDPPEAWRSLGFDVDPMGRFRLGATTTTCLGHGPTGFVSWVLDGVDGDPSAVVGLGLAVMRRLFESAGMAIGELWAANRRSP